MSLTADQLASAVRNVASLRIQTMIEALLQARQSILAHDVGKVEIAFAHEQVKISLSVSLGGYQLQEGEARRAS